MATVVADLSVSLDGFVARPGDEIDEVFEWFTAGDTAVPTKNADILPAFHVDEASAEELRSSMERLGAIVSGRRTFDLAGGWGGKHPLGAPVWVVTHDPPSGFEDAPFTFVTDGVESAIKQASAAAGDGLVAVNGPDIAQQALNAGVLDAVRLSVVPVLLGEGIPYFAGLENTPVKLGQPKVVEGKGVTHLYYEVVK
jgi:dihydrofolate reductase